MPFWAGAGAGLIAGGIGAIGAALTNSNNKREANKNRTFQAEMSNTAHQREIADMRAAGLNPLVAQTSGASTPGGAQAVMENTLEGFAASARDQMQLRMQKEMNDSQKKVNDASAIKLLTDAKVAEKGIPEADMKNKLYEKFGKPLVDKLTNMFDSNSKSKITLPRKGLD